MQSLVPAPEVALSSAPPAFPIVCLGGSAGALDAYVRILSRLSVLSRLAVVIVNHTRGEQTRLAQLLARRTHMPVHVIRAGMPVSPGVFIIPGDHDLTLSDGVFEIQSRSKYLGWPNVITLFLNSVAREWHGTAVAVILSGMDRDGTAALREFRAQGGITIAQQLTTAARPDMPSNAIAGGWVDLILSPEAIGDELNRIAQADLRKEEKRRQRGDGSLNLPGA